MSRYVSIVSLRRSKKHAFLLLAGCALLSTLGACGDGSSGGNGGVAVVPSPPSTTPTPTPTPTSTPAPTGSIATVLEGGVPGLQSGDSVTDFQVTNRGLYMRVTRESSAASDAIVKLHGDPGVGSAWTITEPEGAAGTKLLSYAPSNLSTEADQTVCFYYAATQTNPSPTLIWAKYNASAGGVSPRMTGDPAAATISHVSPEIGNGCISGRSWILYRTTGEDQVRQEDGVYTSAQTILDRFSRVAPPALAHGSTKAIVSHPTDPLLYVGADRELSLYDTRRRVSSWTLPEGTGQFTDLIWYENQLFIGYGRRIYRLNGTTLEVFSDDPVGPEGNARGHFCVSQGEVFLPNGDAIDVSTKAKRSWISKGSLSSEQSTQAQGLATSLNLGVFCSAANASTHIYAPTSDRRIRVITPVSR
jgi:hypothetical protein